MKNLSLNTSEATTLKKSLDVASKNNTMTTENSTSTEQNTSFQMLLNKQVQEKQAEAQQTQAQQTQAQQTQAQQTQAQQTQAQQTQAQQTQSSTSENEVTTDSEKFDPKVAVQNDKSKATSSTKHNSKVNSSKDMVGVNADLNDPKLSISATVDLATKPLIATKKDTDTNVEVLENNQTNNASQLNSTLVSSIIAPITTTVIKDIHPVDSTSLATSEELTPGAEAVTSKNRNLDTILSKALLPGKNNFPVEVEGKDPQISKNATLNSEPSHWIEAMLPKASKQSVSEESVDGKLLLNSTKQGINSESISSKLVLNATQQGISDEPKSTNLEFNAIKDELVKDVGNKDLAVSANYQPTIKMNVAEVIQQSSISNVINAFPGKAGWDQAISQKVIWMVGANEQSATLTLNPPDMGPLQVVINVHNDRADTTFISDNADVRQALQDGMANLRDKMSETGIQLGQASVSSGGQMQQQFQQASQQSSASSALNSNSKISQPEVIHSVRPVVRVSNGLVDTFA